MAFDPHDVTVVADLAAWRAFLDANEDSSDGVWLVLAKKGVTQPTSLTYAEALDEALCSGWIDGQKRSRDVATFVQRFTPRRPRSMWSARNVEHIARLDAEARIRPRGAREVQLARADGRWDRAYPGSADAVAPDDLVAALAAVPGAAERFHASTSQQRFSWLHPILTAATDATRARRIQKVVDELTVTNAS
jgi:uncharacterized protein YdeI (YjbR/CyaY-like superfamily)